MYLRPSPAGAALRTQVNWQQLFTRQDVNKQLVTFALLMLRQVSRGQSALE